VAHGSRLGLRLADAAGATIQALTLGEAEAVGLGFDPNWDTPADAPPASGLAARLLDTGVADPGKQWLTQRFRPRATTSRWRLVVSGLAGRGSPDLTWDVSGADAGREIYLQEIQDEQPVGLPLDMRTQSRLSVTRDAVYEIAYALRSTWRLPLRAGWNLVGNPVMSVQPLGAILGAGARAPGRVGAVWRWDGENYTAVADAAALAPEAGHWVEAAGDGESADIVGILADGITQLRPGWNLVAPVAACAFPAATGLAATAWVWDAAAQAYLPVGPGDTLAAGAGCWLYLDAARSVAVLLAP
jgi:hypothetical protein